MNQIVLDCSVAVAWCFEDEISVMAERLLEGAPESEFVVPAIWPLEVANALLVAERRERVGKADVMRFLEILQTLRIMVDRCALGHLLNRVIPLAREHSLSSYDAAYLELAMREGLPLATQDNRLKEGGAQSWFADGDLTARFKQ